jgi:hypothetical protein
MPCRIILSPLQEKDRTPLSTEPWYLDRSTNSCRITEKSKGNKMSYKFMCSKYEISTCAECVSIFNTMINVQIRVPSQWEQTKISVTGKCHTFGSLHKTLVLLHKTISLSIHRKLYKVTKKSLCTWRLQYNHQVPRDFLITLCNSYIIADYIKTL